jgi:sodium/bile acid cotransporter 7
MKASCKKICRSSCQWARQQWVLLATLATIVAAWVYPGAGAHAYKAATKPLLMVLFALMGLEIDLREFRSACIALHFHAALQIFILLLLPLLYWATCHHWHLAENAGLLTKRFAAGAMATMCLPTTTNTGVMFTQQAAGDVSASAINAAVGNFIGALLAPLVASLTLGGEIAHQDAGEVIRSLLEEIIIPLVVGVVIQICIRASVNVREEVDSRVRLCLRSISSIVLVLILYFIFCKAFGTSIDGVSVANLVLLTVFLIFVHLIVVVLAWFAGAGFGLKRRISFLLMGSQKTESMGVAIISIIFAKESEYISEYTLPIVVYHTVQLLLGASFVGYLRKLAERAESTPDTERKECNPQGSSHPLV